MATVTIDKLSKRFGDFVAIDEIDLEIGEGEFLTLLGPSGCGKTTTLRCLAGLEAVSGGTITIGDRVVNDPANGVYVPTQKRDLGMVFQSYALWPHMTVGGNVSYPLKQRKVARATIGPRVAEVLESVELGGRANQLVTELSGGQQQRVALARALVHEPQLVLYDEPLSNLDALLRQTMRIQIRKLHEAIGSTSLYVTHDQEEAIVLSDRIVVMRDGQIQQVGTPDEVYQRPANAFVADFMGFENLIGGTISEVVDDGVLVAVAPGQSPLFVQASGHGVGDSVTLAVRSGNTSVLPTTADDRTSLAGEVVLVTYLGDRTEVDVQVADDVVVRTRIRDEQRALCALPSPGDQVRVNIDPERTLVLTD